MIDGDFGDCSATFNVLKYIIEYYEKDKNLYMISDLW